LGLQEGKKEMKLIARMIAFLSFLVMIQYANAAGNSIYIDQVGDGSNISITQTGSNNGVGTCTATGGDGIVIIYEYA
jgi:hypothetical protein